MEDILSVLSELEEARHDLEAGLSELLACGLIKKEVKCQPDGEEELHYIVTKEL